MCYRPDSVDKLMELTKFTRAELKVLYRSFKNVRNLMPCNLRSSPVWPVNRPNIKGVFTFGIFGLLCKCS